MGRTPVTASTALMSGSDSFVKLVIKGTVTRARPFGGRAVCNAKTRSGKSNRHMWVARDGLRRIQKG